MLATRRLLPSRLTYRSILPLITEDCFLSLLIRSVIVHCGFKDEWEEKYRSMELFSWGLYSFII